MEVKVDTILAVRGNLHYNLNKVQFVNQKLCDCGIVIYAYASGTIKQKKG